MVRYPVLIMELLVLSIGFLKNIMDLLVDVLNLLNESSVFFCLILNMGRFFLCGCKRYCNINGTQGLESQPHLKWAMVGGTMESPIVTVLDIWKTLVPCTWMLRNVHVRGVQNHLIEDLYLVFSLGLESIGFSDLGVQH